MSPHQAHHLHQAMPVLGLPGKILILSVAPTPEYPIALQGFGAQ